MMKLDKDYTEDCKILFEHSISYNDLSYLVIFGMHINGGFICIPNHNIGCEAADIEGSIEFNTNKLIKCGVGKGAAAAIAEYIDNWISENSELVRAERTAANERLMKRLKDLKNNNII
jgi:hypothetical protein